MARTHQRVGVWKEKRKEVKQLEPNKVVEFEGKKMPASEALKTLNVRLKKLNDSLKE